MVSIDRSPALRRVHGLQGHAVTVHRLFEADYSIGVGVGDVLEIYSHDDDGYNEELTVRLPMSIPPGTLAAFPLPESGECIAVVTDNSLEGDENLIMVLHEFVHCYQYRTCENELRQRLPFIADNHGDPMWEINYPLDYRNPMLGSAVAQINPTDLRLSPEVLRGVVSAMPDEQAQYLIWQMWKEGFARHVENQIRLLLGLHQNTNGANPATLDRSSLYYIGDAFWHQLARESTGAVDLIRGFEVLNRFRTMSFDSI